MASSDPRLTHRHDPCPPSRLPLCHSDSNYPGCGAKFYHHVDESCLGAVMSAMSTPSCRGDDGMSPGNCYYRQDFQPQQQPPYSMQQQQQQQQQPPKNPARITTPKPIRRRMRMITSCLECRRRKLKCNKSNPCINCLKFSRDCLYLGPKLDEASQLRLTEIKEKVGSLERQLERDVARSGCRGLYQQRILADDVEGEFDKERDLEITPMVTLDLTYEDEADGADDMMDLGVQVGRMRLTEKIGGLNRPRISEEIQTGLSSGGPQSGFPGGLISPGFGTVPQSQPGPFSDSGSDQSLTELLRPGASYIPPTSGMFFGQAVQLPSLLTLLPAKPAGDRLLEHYFAAVHPIARCVHRPSFEAQYAGFWEELAVGYEPRPSAQAVVFAAWLSAAVALDETIINREFVCTKATLVENMKSGTEAALSKANFLRTTKVETMQAFVMYMIPLCRDEVSRAHSVLVGAAVRMAECMGLDRDGKRAYNLNPLEAHVRRLIWHQLCFLDIRTCEAQGPRPTIRREDYDTWLPDNCEEDQLTNGTYEPRTSEGWTSMLFSLIRFEVNEMMRIIWTDRRKLESRRITLTQVLTKIENFRRRMLENYDHLLDESISIQRYAKIVMHLLLYRLHVMILHPYYANTTNPMPQRLRSVLIMSATIIIELAMQLDTDPAFGLWKWYGGAYQQYQSALILATEMFYYPNHKEATRIWKCLDYVFSLDCSTPTEDKGRLILGVIMGRMAMYTSMRKARAPTLTASASPSKQAVETEEEEKEEEDEEEEEDNEDDDDDDDDEGDSSSNSSSSSAGAEVDGARNTVLPPSRHTPAPPDYNSPLQNHGPTMKEEPDLIPPMPPGLMQVAPFPISPTGTTTPTAISPHHHHHQQTLTPGAGTSPVGPPPPHCDTPGSTMMMAGIPNTEILWSIPPPSLANSDGPANSSSDDGSVAGAVPRNGSAVNIVMPMNNRDTGGITVSSGNNNNNNMSEGNWSAYQEDTINALFPYNSQTGNFAGFGDPLAGKMNHTGGSWTQESHIRSI